MAGHPIFSLSSKGKRSNLYKLLFVMIICAAFYLIGIWNHRTATVPAVFSAVLPCTSSTALSKSSKPAAATAVKLDFEPHHRGGDFSETQSAGDIHFPLCDAKFSEYTPCEDVQRSLKFERNRLIYRERHCPEKNDLLRCRIPAPFGYKVPFRWPESRGAAWYANVPHKELTVEKKNQNWIRFKGDRFTFPGGGTMFPDGADAYINDIGKLIDLSDGSIRTAIDTGCGVASWGAYLMSRNIVTVSFAPRDTHEAQVQFALERGVPALIGVLASKRLPYPSRAFDMAHCSRCLIPWNLFDGQYLIEIDRVLRPGGLWILSGPPINWQRHSRGWERTVDDLRSEQNTIEAIARSLCWKKIKQREDLGIWQKPTNHVHCKKNRRVFKKPKFCPPQDPDMAWYTELGTCLTPLPEVSGIREFAGGYLAKWPERLTAIPPRISSGSMKEITPEKFRENTQLWKTRVEYYKTLDSQLAEPGRYRNLLDMNSYLGGFAAALVDSPSWVMNVVPVEAEVNTLGVIFERGLIGTYQNWCEAMSTYPRTYDFIHGDSIFSMYENRCEAEDILLEMDRILRPEGSVILRDDVDVLVKLRRLTDALQWDSRIVDHEKGPHRREKILVAVKQYSTAPEVEQNQSETDTIE